MTFTPICVPCAREMRCKKNDYLFSDADASYVWAGDMFECPQCKAQIVTGFGREAVAYAHDEDKERFASYRAMARLKLRYD